MCVLVCCGVLVEMRGQLWKFSPSPCEFRNRTQVISCSRKHLYLMSHLAGPRICENCLIQRLERCSTVESTDCFGSGPVSGTHHAHGDSQPLVTPALGDLTTPFWSSWALGTHICRHICRQILVHV